MSEDEAFILSICESPQDNAGWLVYADWLEERADPRGHLLRTLFALREVASDFAACYRIPPGEALFTRFRECASGYQALALTVDRKWLLRLGSKRRHIDRELGLQLFRLHLWQFNQECIPTDAVQVTELIGTAWIFRDGRPELRFRPPLGQRHLVHQHLGMIKVIDDKQRLGTTRALEWMENYQPEKTLFGFQAIDY